MDVKTLSLKEKILVAAVEGTGGNSDKTFTMEDLVVWAWDRDNSAWGLRGYESRFPDSDKLQKDMGSRGAGQKGVVDMGWVERVGRRVYRLTSGGLAAYAALDEAEPALQEKAGRELEAEVRRILEHPVFRDWLKDNSKPRYFREAGHFWGIAPGTPARTVRERVDRVEETLRGALTLLDKKQTDVIAANRGRILFDRTDIQRCLEFQSTLKSRFARDLSMLDPSFATTAVYD
jgi:DNA-binding PadR family transcriptional regulator